MKKNPRLGGEIFTFAVSGLKSEGRFLGDQKKPLGRGAE